MRFALRQVGGPLRHVGHGHVGHKVTQPAEPPVLGLQLLRQVTAFAKRRILELKVSQNPVLPGFTWVHHWVIQLRLRLHQKVRHVFLLCFILEVLKEDTIIDISVVVLVAQHFVIKVFLQVLPLHPLIDEEGDVVEAGQDGIVNCFQPTTTDFVGIGVKDQEEAHHFQLVLLDCSNEWCLAIGSASIDFCMVLLKQQFGQVKVAIDSSTMEWGAFGIGSEFIAIDEIGSLFQYFFDIGEVITFDVVEEVLAI